MLSRFLIIGELSFVSRILTSTIISSDRGGIPMSVATIVTLIDDPLASLSSPFVLDVLNSPINNFLSKRTFSVLHYSLKTVKNFSK